MNRGNRSWGAPAWVMTVHAATGISTDGWMIRDGWVSSRGGDRDVMGGMRGGDGMTSP